MRESFARTLPECEISRAVREIFARVTLPAKFRNTAPRRVASNLPDFLSSSGGRDETLRSPERFTRDRARKRGHVRLSVKRTDE